MNEEHQNDLQGNSTNVDKVIDSVKKLPREEQEMAISKLEMYSGPIPHPDILKKYDELDPGAAKLIIENGVKESEHRRKLELQAMSYTAKDSKRREWMGFTLGIIIISVGALLIYLGHTITGTLLSGISAVSLVGLFVGSSEETKNKEANDD
ncbi:hypothetical protein SY111_02990 [Ligilactobacillus agilis]|uniref:DUF2335 domain-containing protein n=1 Tax=Ligilactobacillus agilis TaxID=1601 RepID=A0A6F9XR68_9LACO|nr:DUF2335 domain-containing protein [Ligilactobacillus agilis]GET07675.1 hypothetical protein SY111_02990 [Ligilactobacillus agilis]